MDKVDDIDLFAFTTLVASFGLTAYVTKFMRKDAIAYVFKPKIQYSKNRWNGSSDSPQSRQRF